ncbi:immunity 53 family protein [Actinoplanes teichomyceticus]|uniref:Immunity protein 53 of polymorphic toxin system n=1 Tax=Actinoplanes teichomyceticus TaxID=1867 RepID=A0A561WLR0_ACTTI|nr:immunity 53 family protein [Actinoplanes teichomyceticus]TWG24807.1 immunity protein 53 of polymorphic toxin system [Actinoplanes teichomyceticus]
MTDPEPRPYAHHPDPLTWLQGWYAAPCDGNWEHESGVSIETLDHPGWSLTVDLRGTALHGLTFAGHQVHRSEHDWLMSGVDDGRFEVACGPLNLGEAIPRFRLWAAQHDAAGRHP